MMCQDRVAANVPGFAKVGNSKIRCSLGRNFYFITAKLLKLIRITNVDWLYSSAQLLQSQLLGADFFILLLSSVLQVRFQHSNSDELWVSVWLALSKYC